MSRHGQAFYICFTVIPQYGIPTLGYNISISSEMIELSRLLSLCLMGFIAWHSYVMYMCSVLYAISLEDIVWISNTKDLFHIQLIFSQ